MRKTQCCEKCAVKLHIQEKVCPLCKTPLASPTSANEHRIPLWPTVRQKTGIATKNKLLLLWLPMVLISLIGFLLILCSDILSNHSLTWSRYPLISLIAGILYISSIFLFSNKFFIMYTWYGFGSLSLLVIFDKFSHSPDWLFKVCVPTIALIYLYGIINYFILMGIKRRMILFVSFNCLFAALYYAILGLIIAGYLEDTIFAWAPVAFCICISMALMGFYYYIFLKKQLDLKKFFHI